MTDFEQKKLRAEHLRNELNHHIYRYYVENENDISDYEYDMLMRELDSIEKEYPELLAPDSPTHRVGGQADGLFETVVHTVKMESLQDVFSYDELRTFLPKAKAHGLAAIETSYSTFDAEKTASAQALAEEFGLMKSGGSDFHGANKPNIALGIGLGDLRVPAEYYTTLAASNLQ